MHSNFPLWPTRYTLHPDRLFPHRPRPFDDPDRLLKANPFPHPATVQKIITEILSVSPGMAFTKEARDLLIECCVEFITLISSEANDIAEREAKKTIATEHIDKALRELGFPEYVEEVVSVAEEHKEQLKVL